MPFASVSPRIDCQGNLWAPMARNPETGRDRWRVTNLGTGLDVTILGDDSDDAGYAAIEGLKPVGSDRYVKSASADADRSPMC